MMGQVKMFTAAPRPPTKKPEPVEALPEPEPEPPSKRWLATVRVLDALRLGASTCDEIADRAGVRYEQARSILCSMRHYLRIERMADGVTLRHTLRDPRTSADDLALPSFDTTTD